jgi:hypothetical protein
MKMNNSERHQKISELSKEIDSVNSNISNLWLKKITGTFEGNENITSIEKCINDLSLKKEDLMIKRQGFQVSYVYEFVNSSRLIETGFALLNIDVEINTKKEGWDAYGTNVDARRVITDIWNILSQMKGSPIELVNISKYIA